MTVIDSSIDITIRNLNQYISIMSKLDSSFLTNFFINLNINLETLEEAKKILEIK